MGIIRALRFVFLWAGCTICGSALGHETDLVESDKESTMDYTDALVYGLVEGVTEFLPVSSTGHLILTKEWMAEDSGVEATTALNAYLIVIQAGAILAVGFLYWRDVWAIALGVFGLDPRGRVLGRNLLLAFLPAAALGPFLDEFIEASLFGPMPVVAALATGAVLMFWAERMRSRRERVDALGGAPGLRQMKPGSALFIGVMQCVAMWPGTSRSMMTIVGGYLVGLRPVKAAEFSFLLGLVTLTAAAGYKVLTKGEEMVAYLEPGPVVTGCLAAGISAALAVRWLVGYLTRRGLGLFAWYRLALALMVLALI